MSIDFDATIARFDALGINLLTTEGKIVFLLSKKGEARVKELMLATGSSYRGFYLSYDRLKTKGVLISTVDPSDRRARIARLASA